MQARYRRDAPPRSHPPNLTLRAEAIKEPDQTREGSTLPTTTANGLNRLEVLQGLRISIWEAAFATIWAALTSGAFLTGFALWLGADSFAIGLLTAIPTFAGLVQILSSYTGERRKTRKGFAAGFLLAGRMLWLPILLLPWLLSHTAVYPFLLLFTASFVLVNIPVPAWTSWMSDLVPADYRGRYFARRNMIAGIVGMLISLPAAWFLDVATKRHHWEFTGFGTLFGVGAAGALIAYLFLLRQPEPPKQIAPASEAPEGLKGMLAYFRAPFADPNFRRLMLFNTLFGTGQFFAAPFFTVYALQVLKLNYIWLQLFATLTSISSLASMPLWGYLADKFGNKPLLAIGVCGVFTLPITWMWTTPNHALTTLLLLVELNLVGGLFWAGVGLTQFNLLIGFSPQGKTSIYVATMAAVTGLAGGLAPLLGSAVMKALQGWSGNLLGLTLTNYHITFLIAALLRIFALIFLKPVVDARSATAGDVLRQLGQANPRSWRHIRQLQRGDQEARLRATEALGGSKTQLAVNELQAALTDPSQAVREEAARALGEIGDPAAVNALIAALRDPAAGLIDEAALALGRIGDRSANGPLSDLLLSPPDRISRRDRILVAQALGKLGGSDAVTALLQALEQTEDEEMLETLTAALGKTGSSRATSALVERLLRPEIAYGLRQTLVRAFGEIGDPAAIPALRGELARDRNDPTILPLLADALARLEDGEAALALLPCLQVLESEVARKQVAHAIGRLLGQGESVYALLSQDPMTRDGSVTRLLQELQKALPASGPDPDLPLALKAYTTGDNQACLQALHRASHALPPSETPPEEAQQALCRRFLEVIGDLTAEPPAEAVLLAFCALSGLKPTTRSAPAP